MSKKIKSKQIETIPTNEELDRLIANSGTTIEEINDAVTKIYYRNVQFVETGEEIGDITNENDFIAAHTYGIGWVENASTCERIGNSALHDSLPIHESLKACTTTFDNQPFTLTENGYTLSYGGKQVFKKWLNPTNWYEYEDGTDAKADIEGLCDVWIHNSKFYYKSFKNVTKNDVNTEGNYNMVLISTRRYNNTWNVFKAGYTAFTKAFREDGVQAAPFTGESTEKARSYSSTKEALEVSTGAMKATSMTAANLKIYQESDGICRAATTSDRLNVHKAAMNNGCHLMSFEEYQILFYWLPAIEFCTFNIESNSSPANTNTFFNTGDVITKENHASTGYGYPMWYLSSYTTNLDVADVCPRSSIPAGFTNALGSRTGWVKYLAGDSNRLPAVRYRGFEIKRDIWTNVYGCYGVDDGDYKKFYVTRNRAKWDNSAHVSDPNFTKEFRLAGQAPHVTGTMFATEFSLNSCADLVATGYISSVSNSKGDRIYTSTVSGPSYCLFGGGSGISSGGGPGYRYSNSSAGYAHASVGFRTRFNDDEYVTIYN